ncbi:MAG TPA: sigma-70 family RNA polymerase sigma factor [Terriglobales bacterium]|nr:sigma-70 family RNA polymerase sigma factor [Terriglobales bacterium]
MESELNPAAAAEVRVEGIPDDDTGPTSSWSDTRLIRECLAGDERAWAVLIDRYKRLIYSIPMKYGARPEDAADILQAVCIELFSELSNLRKTESLKSWLISVTAHQAFHWKKRQRPGQVDLDGMEPEEAHAQVRATDIPAPELLEEVEQEQMVREAIRQLPPRCAEMVRLLFYEHPPLPYAEVARRLGLATGSIGFIRGRCLKRLEKNLMEMGF